MKIRNALVLSAALAPIVWAVACGSDDNATGPAPTVLPAGVETLRTSLAPYSSLALAKAAGYSAAITDCMSNGDEGAMGIHFGNTQLFDAVVDAAHPEVLIYEPGADGERSLVGVEFLVPYAAVPATAPAPELFGQKFVHNDVFGVWALHVWTHRSNPSGLFSDWNPRVHC